MKRLIRVVLIFLLLLCACESNRHEGVPTTDSSLPGSAILTDSPTVEPPESTPWDVEELELLYEDDLIGLYAAGDMLSDVVLQYGGYVQKLDEFSYNYFRPDCTSWEDDSDGDGIKELYIIHQRGSGTGAAIDLLTVCEPNGEKLDVWYHDITDIQTEFNENRIAEYDPEHKTVTISYGGQTNTVELGDWDWYAQTMPMVSELAYINGMQVHYEPVPGGVRLTFALSISGDGVPPLHYLPSEAEVSCLLRFTGEGFEVTDQLGFLREMVDNPTQEDDPEAASTDYFQKLLTFDGGETWYNGALTCVYDSPEKINLEFVFYISFPGAEEWNDFTAEEQTHLISEGAKKNLSFGYIPAQKRSAKQLDDALQGYFGVSLSEVRIPDSWVYYERTDSYYSSHSDIHVVEDFIVTKVEQGEDGLIWVFYTAEDPIVRQDGTSLDGREHTMVLTLQSKAGNLVSPDGYVVVSNQPYLEELKPEPYNIQDVVNRILVGEIRKDTEWSSMDNFILVSADQMGRVDRYNGTPKTYYNLSSTPGHELMKYFRWSPIDASEWAALSANRYLLEFSNDWYSFTVCSDDNKIAIEVNGETLYYEAEPVYGGAVFSTMCQYAEIVLLEHEYKVCQVNGLETDYAVIAQELAEQYAQCILDRPGWATQRAADAQVRDIEVFDAYYGKDNPNFCFDKRLYLKVTEEQWFFWQVGSGLDGPYTEGLYEGWSGHGMQVRVRKKEDGNWHMTGMVTGGATVILPVSLRDAAVQQLMEWYFLTEGWTHDWLIPYRLSEMPLQEIKDQLSVLEDERRRELTDALLEFVMAYPEYAIWKAEDL